MEARSFYRRYSNRRCVYFAIFGHKRTRAVLATLILSSEALFAVLGGVVLLGETLNLKEILGCIIMLFAIIFSRIPSIKKGETK